MNEEGKKHTIINDMIFIFVIYYLTHLIPTHTHLNCVTRKGKSKKTERKTLFESRVKRRAANNVD